MYYRNALNRQLYKFGECFNSLAMEDPFCNVLSKKALDKL